MLPVLLLFAPFADSNVNPAANYSVFPEKVVLRDPWDSQKILVFQVKDGLATQFPSDVQLHVDPPGLAVIEAGTVRPRRNGSGKVNVRHGSWSASVPIEVSNLDSRNVPDFLDQVEPVITGLGCNSGACHGALAGKGGLKLSLRAYDPSSDHQAIVFQMLGRRVDRHDASKSLLIQKALGEIRHGGGKRLEKGSAEHELLLAWIAGGAPLRPSAQSNFQGIEIVPPVARLEKGQTSQSVVLAKSRDGTYRDVTRLAKFSSANESVCGVAPDGSVTAIANGESAISAWFNNMVAVNRVQVPYAKGAVTQTSYQFKPNTWIDEFLSNRWRELNIIPSAGISDDEFLRRLWIDCLGTLPSPELLAEYRADLVPGKRDRWIEKALSSETFVDYWTYKWSDLFLVRTGRLQQSAVWAFNASIRSSVRENWGWDRLTRSMLTANGSTLHNGLGNFFGIHRDPAELAESVSVTFMGQSIGCAKCHNHPMDKWTQDQYWGFANIFGRIGLKTGQSDGEMVVCPLPLGDVPHLRTARPVLPAPLDGPVLSTAAGSDRRALFVDWLLAKENQFFARTQANRLWRHFFARGLVEPDDDMRQTNPSMLEPILARLAQEFRTTGHDNKAIMRLILRSSAYQLSSRPSSNNETEELFFSRYHPRRLQAEVLLDAYSQITRVPTAFESITPGGGNGTTRYAGYPLGIRAIQLPDAAVSSPFLDVFGRPERLQSCSCERSSETGIGQVLQIANGQLLNEKISKANNIIDQWIKSQMADAELAAALFRSALSRDPNTMEMKSFVGRLNGAKAGMKREVLEDCLWALLTSNEFLLNH